MHKISLYRKHVGTSLKYKFKVDNYFMGYNSNILECCAGVLYEYVDILSKDAYRFQSWLDEYIIASFETDDLDGFNLWKILNSLIPEEFL